MLSLVLRREGEQNWIDYTLHGAQGTRRGGELRDDDVLALGLTLMLEVRDLLMPGSSTPLGLVSRDTFNNQACARALALFASQVLVGTGRGR